MATTNSTLRKKNLSPAWTSFILATITVAMVAVAWYAAPGLNWILVVALMTGFLVVLGIAITGRAAGS